MEDNWLLAWLMAFLCATTHYEVCGFNLTILHTNDIHSRIQEMNRYNSRCTEGKCYGGQARLKSKIDELRAKYPNNLLLDAGDQYQGTTFFYVYEGQIMSHFMNALRYDAMALGNHEFDLGPSGLKPFLDNVTFPVLSCNTDVSKAPGMASVKKSVVLNVSSGQKVGIIGYTTADVPTLSSPGKVTFGDEISAIQVEVEKLKKLGVKMIIGLGHAGYQKDLDIAKMVRDVDVIVGGHSNTFLYTGDPPANEKPMGLYPTVVKNTAGQRVLVVQDFAYGKYLGFLQVNFDKNGVVTAWNGNPILMDNSVPKDPGVEKLIQVYLPQVEKMMAQKVGQSLVYLEGDRAVCRVRECNLGNFIADAIVSQNLRYTNSTKWNHVAIALFGGGGIRAPISRGDILMSDVLGVMPFKNTIDMVELPGKTLLDVLEHSAAKWVDKGDLFGGFLQMSGLRVVYDMRQKVGRRVIQAQALCTDCTIPEFKPVNLKKTYQVMSSSFTIKGGDGYSMIKENMGKSHVIGDLDSDMLLNYIKKASPISQGLDGRIQFLEDIEKHQYCPGTSSVGKLFYNLLLITSLIAIAKFVYKLIL